MNDFEQKHFFLTGHLKPAVKVRFIIIIVMMSRVDLLVSSKISLWWVTGRVPAGGGRRRMPEAE